MRSGSPCVIFLKSFSGCYDCKRRSVYCSLGAGVHGKGPSNKALAWWITLIHHICSVLDLDTVQGPISVLPDYANVELSDDNMPSWAVRAFHKIRKRMGEKVRDSRWVELQASIIPTWTFYAMPHSLLASLGEARPVRSFWPRPGSDHDDVIQRGISILARGRDGTLPRLWASQAKVDGYNYLPKEDVNETKVKKEIKPKKQEGKVASESEVVEQNSPETSGADTDIPHQPVHGKYRVVYHDTTGFKDFTGPSTDVEQPMDVEQNAPIDVDMLFLDPSPADDTGAQSPSRTISPGEEEALSTEAPPLQTPSIDDSHPSLPEPNAVCSPGIVLDSQSDHTLQSSLDTIEQIHSAPPAKGAYPTLPQGQVGPHIADILASLHGLTIHGQQVDRVLADLLSTMQLGNSMLENHCRIHSMPVRQLATVGTSTSDLAPTPEPVLIAQRHFATVGTSTSDLVSTPEPVMIPQRQFATVGTSTSDLAPAPEPVVISQRPFATVDTSTSYLTPTHKRISSAAQTYGDETLVASTTPAIETPYVPYDNSETQPATNLGGHGIVEIVTQSSPEPMEYTGLSSSPKFPTSDLRATNEGTFEGHPSGNHDVVDTERQGMIIGRRFSV